MSTDAIGDLVEVRILNLPVEVSREAAEHHDELRREFALIHGSALDDKGVPARLQKLIDDLEGRFAAFTGEPTSALQRAQAERQERIDLVYRVPSDVRQACVQLDDLLDEADAFCHEGEHLLTLATPPVPLAFRRWFLSEFVAQIDGADPTPWDQFAARDAET